MKTDLIFYKPLPHISSHPGGCFRELLDLWYLNDFCDVVNITEIKSTNYQDSTLIPESRPWVGGVGQILLYDNTLLDKLPSCGYQKALFANEVLHDKNTSNWIWWPRFPERYYQFQNNCWNKEYEQRKIESCFIGNFTTNKRMGDWQKYIEFFRMGNSNNHHEKNMLFGYNDYLNILANSKFGLCLPGVGPKSLRENELMGLGTVPIFTPGVSTDYFDKPIENKHYIFVNSPQEIPQKLASVSKEQWEYMSISCLNWFSKNSSLEGSFNQTIKIIGEL